MAIKIYNAKEMEYNPQSDWKGLLITGLLLFISTITLSTVALIGTSLAGLTTAWLNIYKFYKLRKSEKEKKDID